MDHLVSIGRFSDLTRLSVKALRHYDKLGLLTPAEIDPRTGYRRYRLSQAGTAEAIRVLRGLDMSLDDIAAVLRAEDDAAGTAVLRAHRERLVAALADAEHRLDHIERLIKQEEPLVPYTVTTRTVPDQTVASLRREASLETVGAVVGEGFGLLFGAIVARGTEPAGMPFLVMHDVIDADASGTIEMCIPVAEPLALDAPTTSRTVEGGRVATVVHHGAYDEVGPAYHALAGWMADEGCEPAGPPREIYLNDPTEVDAADLRTEVQWPVREATSD